MTLNANVAGAGPQNPDLTVIMVSHNTREMTLTAIRSLYEQTQETSFELIVLDNASSDGSAEAIANAFPQARLIRSADNLGFARANNMAAEQARGRWLLLLNPDTEIYDRAVDRLVAFAEAHPAHKVYGGRTVYPDGSLNAHSCLGAVTPWSAFCRAVGLSALFPKSALFNSEMIGGWKRDSIREIDVVVGCFLLIPLAFWRKLGGFDLDYWMYGEDYDLCIRAKACGARPVIVPEATIMHVFGASSASRAEKLVPLLRARSTLIDRHWPVWQRPWGRFANWLWIASRAGFATALCALPTRRFEGMRALWLPAWRARAIWMQGYPRSAGEPARASLRAEQSRI